MATQILLFENGAVRTGASLEEAARLVSKPSPGALVWIDCDARTPQIDALLSGPLGVHRLTQEDLWADREAPKAEAFPGYLFVLFHAVRLVEPAPSAKPGSKEQRAKRTELERLLKALG